MKAQSPQKCKSQIAKQTIEYSYTIISHFCRIFIIVNNVIYFKHAQFKFAYNVFSIILHNYTFTISLIIIQTSFILCFCHDNWLVLLILYVKYYFSNFLFSALEILLWRFRCPSNTGLNYIKLLYVSNTRAIHDSYQIYKLIENSWELEAIFLISPLKSFE